MSIKKAAYVPLSYLCALISFICAFIVILVALIPSIRIKLSYYASAAVLAFVFIILSAVLGSIGQDEEKKKKIAHRATTAMFAVYLTFLTIILLLGVMYKNGQPFILKYNKLWLREPYSSLVPFRNIINSFKDFAMKKSGLSALFYNVIGNTVLYTPFALFMPIYKKSLRYFDSFLPFTVFLIVGIEITQGIFTLGTCDIDDIILGVSGACIAYCFFRSGPIVSFFERNYIYR